MDNDIPKSKLLKIDLSAKSQNPGEPPFISPPKGSPVYYGFPLIEETRTEDWCYGAITEFAEDIGSDYGDGFVEAPDHSRAGLVWEVGNQPIKEICPPDEKRWGVYAVSFPRIIRNTEDLIFSFRYILPELKVIYKKIHPDK